MVCSRRCIVVTIDGALYNVDVDWIEPTTSCIIRSNDSIQNPAPFINKELRKAVYKKRQLYNKYNKGNAKRGVSPRLKIWPGDLENQ